MKNQFVIFDVYQLGSMGGAIKDGTAKSSDIAYPIARIKSF